MIRVRARWFFSTLSHIRLRNGLSSRRANCVLLRRFLTQTASEAKKALFSFFRSLIFHRGFSFSLFRFSFHTWPVFGSNNASMMCGPLSRWARAMQKVILIVGTFDTQLSCYYLLIKCTCENYDKLLPRKTWHCTLNYCFLICSCEFFQY